MQVSHDPAQGWLLLCAVAMVVGLLGSLGVRRRRLWLRITPSGDADDAIAYRCHGRAGWHAATRATSPRSSRAFWSGSSGSPRRSGLERPGRSGRRRKGVTVAGINGSHGPPVRHVLHHRDRRPTRWRWWLHGRVLVRRGAAGSPRLGRPGCWSAPAAPASDEPPAAEPTTASTVRRSVPARFAVVAHRPSARCCTRRPSRSAASPSTRCRGATCTSSRRWPGSSVCWRSSP